MLKITTFMSMQPVSHVFSIVLLTKVLMKVQMPYRLSRMKMELIMLRRMEPEHQMDLL